MAELRSAIVPSRLVRSLRRAYLAEIGTTVVTGFVCTGAFSSPPEASAPCDELDTTAIVIRSFVLSGVFLGEPVLRAAAEENS